MKKLDLLSEAFEKFESDIIIEKNTMMVMGGMFTGTSGCATGDTFSGSPNAADDCDCDTDDADSDSIPAVSIPCNSEVIEFPRMKHGSIF